MIGVVDDRMGWYESEIGFGVASQKKVCDEARMAFVGFGKDDATRGTPIQPMHQALRIRIQCGQETPTRGQYMFQTQ
eukprot:scaffold289707_cov24-Attheya_sp.AAC.1